MINVLVSYMKNVQLRKSIKSVKKKQMRDRFSKIFGKCENENTAVNLNISYLVSELSEFTALTSSNN